MKQIKNFYERYEDGIKFIACIGGLVIITTTLCIYAKHCGEKVVAKENLESLSKVKELINSGEYKDALFGIEDLNGNVYFTGGPNLIKIMKETKFEGVDF